MSKAWWGTARIVVLALALAAGNAAAQEAETAQPQGPKTTELRAVPVEYRAVDAADFFLPIGEAVRADTWDMLAVKPDHPVTLRLACIVMTASGAPGACVDAALLPKGQKTIDWTRMRELSDVADQSATLADLQLRGIANQRIDAALLPARAGSADLFVIRFFEETIAPADARPPFADGAAPLIKGVMRAKPIDGALLANLYPPHAIRFAAAARVSMICRITAALNLLCRDPGTIEFAPGTAKDLPVDVPLALRHATYQLASAMRLEAKNRDGEDVVGRAYRFTIVWKLPEN